MVKKKTDDEAPKIPAPMMRIRAAVGTALNISPEARVTDAMLAEAVERICRAAAATVPGLTLLARDLNAPADP